MPVAVVSVGGGGGGGACLSLGWVVVSVFGGGGADGSVTVAVVVGAGCVGGVDVVVDADDDIDGFGSSDGRGRRTGGRTGCIDGWGRVPASVPGAVLVGGSCDAVAGRVKFVVVSTAVFVLGGITVGGCSPGAPTVELAALVEPS